MKEEAARKLIKKRLLAEFKTIKAAADNFGKTHQALDNALAGNQKDIPAYLLNHAGLKAEINYVEKKKC